MEKLLLAISGGVDSSTALLLLKDKYEVIAGTLKLHTPENSGNTEQSCDNSGNSGSSGKFKDIEDAKAVAEKFGVPHYVYDMQELFRSTIIDSFINSYINGDTPNPCVECNRYIKFGALLEKAKELGCEKIATGHYANVEYNPDSGRYLLKKATLSDGNPNPKDQSYVLYQLTQEQLSCAVFPLGNLDKEQIRELARQNGLLNSEKSDSQDICFVPDGSYGDFLERSGVQSQSGNFLDISGNVIGQHKGQMYYTTGQRRGIGIGFGKPMYVISKNAKDNTVTLGENELLFKNRLTVIKPNWIAYQTPPGEFRCKAKTRYKQTEQPCTVYTDGDMVRVVFDSPVRAVTPGQHVVFYDGDVVLGGGVIAGE